MIKKFAFFVACALLLPSLAHPSVLLDRVVAVVDRDIITWSELYRAILFEYQKEVRDLSKDEKEQFIDGLSKQFLEVLIDNRLQLAEAERKGITVSRRDVESALNNMRKNARLSESQFREALLKEGSQSSLGWSETESQH